MDTNPYAPPVAPLLEPAPGKVALWNPGAAASWSLMFTPAFGAYLHMRNWQALGDKDKADAAKLWMIGALIATVGLQIVGFVAPQGGLITRAGSLSLLLGWYFASGKTQIALVKERYGDAYEHRGWLAPLGIAFGILAGLAVVAMAVIFSVLAAR